MKTIARRWWKRRFLTAAHEKTNKKTTTRNAHNGDRDPDLVYLVGDAKENEGYQFSRWPSCAGVHQTDRRRCSPISLHSGLAVVVLRVLSLLRPVNFLRFSRICIGLPVQMFVGHSFWMKHKIHLLCVEDWMLHEILDKMIFFLGKRHF